MSDIVERLRWSISADTPARYPDIVNDAIKEITKLREQLANAKTLGMIANSGPSLADIKLSLKGTETYQIVDGQWRRVENASVGTGSS